ncbi:MAG: rhombosortase [Ignavibacteriae bacterium HGW-Ignavibacteriae-2]|jgi:membrane associated rhomboid family serine protease|nr:rhomboid family intramembrane serine protease [Bacteroidota bacterium]PKL88941.1 MAG: rhombosortase [Ignavibacteriae bacterium HGW-Ignavibacteriae-2]
MTDDKQKFIDSIKIPSALVLILWGIKIIESLFKISLVGYGLFPRRIEGLFGIFTFPLLHGSWDHLFSNTLPLFLLSMGICYFYTTSSNKVLLGLYFVPGILLWLFGRASFHIGASGMIYGMVSFLFFSGIIRRDKRAIVLALLVSFFYGGLVWGILPVDSGVSWEGHLFGGITGLVFAIVFRKKDPFEKYDWEDEDDDDYDPRDLEVSYKKGYPFD